MKHLLLNRFQGALVGANIIYVDRQQLIPNQLIIETTPSLIAGINHLILPDKFDVNKWMKNISGDISSPDRAVLAMLPLMLFFHDDRVKLREIIINVSHNWQLDWETCASAVAIGYIISRSLTESFNPSTIIPQLLDEMSNLHPLLFQELSTIDRLLGSSNSLQQIIQRIAAIPHPIIAATVMAIYCFLSTPEDFSLAVRRAYQVKDRSLLTCALTGILAGTQNSLTEIPLNGYMATQSRLQWLLAAESLVASWAGVYHEHSASLAAGAHPLSVTSPKVMQRRD
jgi:hypothetical protein